ncbi:hypothetical protein TNCT_291251 [Trichonephila clavata]|uniref:Uncharacterized protein n=1 Tax=Trichonephila clavata TaxID=2740835 RepID=A0A8X6FK82_TRICU|nr:hypothetical protein TNCT_291251 [Trichonephila clavata]
MAAFYTNGIEKKYVRVESYTTEFSKWLLKIGNNEIKQLEIPSELLCEDVVEEIHSDGITVEQMTRKGSSALSYSNPQILKTFHRQLCEAHRESGKRIELSRPRNEVPRLTGII